MTRDQLIDVINSTREHCTAERSLPIFDNILADKLIEKGFCKVDEPREFWINKEGPHTYVYEHNDFGYREGSEIIHVREVVEE